MIKKRLLAVVFCVFLGFFLLWPALLPSPEEKALEEEIKGSVNGNYFTVELAVTPEEKTQGLSGRESLPEDTVLVFVFEELSKHGIWMPEMMFSIDIIWLDDDKRVVFYEKEVSPETFPEVFIPPAPARYVVEANEGFVDKNGVKEGDVFVFENDI